MPVHGRSGGRQLMTTISDFPGDAQSNFRDLVGYRLVEWEEGRARLALDIDDRHMNRSGLLHGGVLTTVMDAAGGYAGTYCTVQGNVRRCVTVSLDAKFLASAAGQRITVDARLVGGGRQLFFADIEVGDDTGLRLAVGHGVYRLRRGSEDLTGVPLDADGD